MPSSGAEVAGGGAGDGKTRRCVFCGAEVRRNECHKNRYGEYVCLTCRGQGKRWSGRQTFRRSARRWAVRLLYVVLVVIGLGVAYVVLTRTIQAITPSAE